MGPFSLEMILPLFTNALMLAWSLQPHSDMPKRCWHTGADASITARLASRSTEMLGPASIVTAFTHVLVPSRQMVRFFPQPKRCESAVKYVGAEEHDGPH